MGFGGKKDASESNSRSWLWLLRLPLPLAPYILSAFAILRGFSTDAWRPGLRGEKGISYQLPFKALMKKEATLSPT